MSMKTHLATLPRTKTRWGLRILLRHVLKKGGTSAGAAFVMMQLTVVILVAALGSCSADNLAQLDLQYKATAEDAELLKRQGEAGRLGSRVTKLSADKCDFQDHRELCQHMASLVGKDLTWTSKPQENDIYKGLYDAYHKDRGIGGSTNRTSLLGEGERLLPLLDKLFPASSHRRVFEGGPGACHMMRTVKARGYDVAAQEVSQFAIDSFCSELEVKQGLLRYLDSYKSGEFDLAYSMDCIEHVPVVDLIATFKEVRRVVKVGGYFVFDVARCASDAKGVAGSNAIHSSGVCAQRPRELWHQLLVGAGWTKADEATWKQMEDITGLTAAVRECEEKYDSFGTCANKGNPRAGWKRCFHRSWEANCVRCGSRDPAIWGGMKNCTILPTAFNKRGHRWFFYRNAA